MKLKILTFFLYIDNAEYIGIRISPIKWAILVSIFVIEIHVNIGNNNQYGLFL